MTLSCNETLMWLIRVTQEMQTAITTAIKNIPGPPERPKSSGECWFTRCGRGCRAGRPWEGAGHRVASAIIIQRRRPTGCRSGQANSPNVSQPQAHPRATTGSLLLVSRDFTRHRHVGNPLQAWLPTLLHMPVSVQRGGTIECCLFKFPS